MPWTHDIGPFYWHTLRYPEPIRWEHRRAVTHEIEPPYREGRGVTVRVGRHTVLVLGKWHSVERTEDEALQAALGASALDVDTELIKEWDRGLPAEDDAGRSADEGGSPYCVIADPGLAGPGGAVPISDR